MKQFIAFVKKEFYHIFRDRRTMLILLGMPVVQIILFGFAISTEVKNVRLAVLDPSNDVVTRKIIDRLDASEYFTVTTRFHSPQEMETAFRKNKIDMAIVFGERFADGLYTGDARVQLIVDATDPNMSTSQSNYAASIVSSAGQEMLPPNVFVSRLTPDVKLLYNPQMKSAYNFVPGVMGLILMLICAMMTSISIVREKETGTRAFLFFAYPTKMSGDAVWVSGDTIFGMGQAVDGLTVATPLGQAATSGTVPAFNMDMITGLSPGSIGETSVIAILIGAVILLWTGVASWKTMLSVFVGGAFMAWVFNAIGMENNTMAQMPWYEHLVLGGFCFGAVFMATDPVTSARTERGKYIFGFLIGVMAIVIRVLNPGYPEGMMLAILLMNIFAPLIDYCVVQSNISRREKRTIKSNQ